jgi:hypothetical protein
MEQNINIPLLLREPRTFMAAVVSKERVDKIGSLRTLDDQMACAALRHGVLNDQSARPDLIHFYTERFLPAPVERRKQIYGYVKDIVPQLGADTAGAFTPFMLLDTDISIVSTATVDYTSVGTLFDGDPMTRPRDVIDLLAKGFPRNRAAVIGGLLVLGDPRVSQLAKPIRDDLDDGEVTVVGRCAANSVACRSTVEFYLEWLDELVDRRDYRSVEIFGNVAAGLHNIAVARRSPFVWDGFRPFPAAGHEDDWATREKIHPAAFSALIADKLYDIEKRERVPKVMPTVIRAFGLPPKTPPSEEPRRQAD